MNARARGSALILITAAIAIGMISTVHAEPVRVGLERLSEDAGQILHEKRLGLIVHAASVTADGRHAIEVLHGHDLEIVRLFTPEHGLWSREGAGENVDSGIDAATGLAVVSLYGDRRRPQPEDLAGLDVLVFDLQGAGVRFYTYVSTLILCLEAAADAGLEFVVLDRPNPLGGERIEGPVAAPREIVPESFVNLAPGPLVHGLTMGEMARYVNAKLDKPARLTVVTMAGWTRAMTWADTGRPWVPPSPNLRTADAALAYPGTALLEATNVSEGRGTPSPFLLLGAPWLTLAGQRALVEEVRTPGFELAAAKFTPRSSAAAPRPKHSDQECLGWRVAVTDPAKAQPYRLGLELLRALARQPGLAWTRDGEALTWLLGTPNVFRDLKEGKSVDEILAADEKDHLTWRRDRRAALLY